MVREHDEMYAVVMQSARNQGWDALGDCERTVTVCATYGEARRIKQHLAHGPDICIIRYLGETGGGD